MNTPMDHDLASSQIAPNPDFPPASPDPTRGVSVSEIINGTRCSPLTLSEFESFLIHFEHSVENLQFTVWYRSYCERFAALSPEMKALSDSPEERYRPYGAGSLRTSSMRTGSIMDRDRSWWDKLTKRKSVSTFDEEKGTGDWDADHGFGPGVLDEGQPKVKAEAVEMKQTSSDGSEQMEGLKEVNEDGSHAERARDVEPESGDDVSFTTAVYPKSTLRPAPASPFPSRPTSVVNPPSPAPGTPLVGKAPLDRTVTNVSNISDTDTEALDKKTSRFPNLRFANLAPLINKSSRDKTLPEGTPLPFVDEISLILTTFILPGSSRELNLDARLRAHILKSLQPVDADGNKLPPRTTHPDVFKEAEEHAFDLMERSLPKYLSFAKGNTNAPKTLFWYLIGALDFGIGIMLAMIILFYARSRWWRIFAFVFIQFGVMQGYSASRYFCSQVHGRTSRQLYPWELTSMIDGEDATSVGSPTAPTFAIAMKPGDTAQPKSDLSNSLPFLFDEKHASGVAPPTPTKADKIPSKFWRSRFFTSWKRSDGSRMKIFGPERVVEDEYIKYLHNQQIKEILIVGAVVTWIIMAGIIAIPEQTPRR